MSVFTKSAVDSEVAARGGPLGCLDVFSTSPQSLGADRDTYLKQVADVARWSERAGCRGILVYTDNSIVDPWLVAQVIIESTESLCPLIAVQPIYMHPYSVAKMVTSFAFLYGRRVYLNMVAGGFKNDLVALDDQTPHDKRYDRLVEYTTVVQKLLSSDLPVSFEGEFYKISNLALKPPLPSKLLPGIFISGSSAAGVAAASSLGATAIKYPEPPQERTPSHSEASNGCGVRVGVIAREAKEAAWEVAYARFPSDRRGQIAHELAMKISDSAWHKHLSAIGPAPEENHTYWLGPFQNSKSNCPYLVGDYDAVAHELNRYVSAGYRTFILDIPPCEKELEHIGSAFKRAVDSQVKNIQ